MLTTRSPAKDLSTLSLTEALIDAPSTVNSDTTATPTRRAEAVLAVRRGFRKALSRASVPVIPRNRASGAPSVADAGPATTGPSTTTPDDEQQCPEPGLARLVLLLRGREDDQREPAHAQDPATDQPHPRGVRCVEGDVAERGQWCNP